MSLKDFLEAHRPMGGRVNLMTTEVASLLGRPAGRINTPDVVPKGWGAEYIYANGEYCMKILYFAANARVRHTSMHFHIQKHETLLVLEGELVLKYIVDKEVETTVLHAGTAWTVPPGHPHRLQSLDPSTPLIIMETSTHDDQADSIRID